MAYGVIEYDSDGNPKCEICGKYFKRVSVHAAKKHFISKKEYKEQFGLYLNRGVCNKESSIATSMSMKKYSGIIAENLKKSEKFRYKKGSSGRGPVKKNSQEYFEMIARCPDMLNRWNEIRRQRKQPIISEPEVAQIVEQNVKRKYTRRFENDTPALESLADRIAALDDKLLMSCIFICGNKNDAYDLKQDTIYVALTTEYDERNQLYSYLYGIAKNLHYANHKIHKNDKVEYVDEYPEKVIEEVADVIEEEPVRKLNRNMDYYIDQLSENDRKIFKLRYIKISYMNIAERTGLNVDYVKTRYWMIRQQLKSMIQADA